MNTSLEIIESKLTPFAKVAYRISWILIILGILLSLSLFIIDFEHLFLISTITISSGLVLAIFTQIRSFAHKNYIITGHLSIFDNSIVIKRDMKTTNYLFNEIDEIIIDYNAYQGPSAYGLGVNVGNKNYFHIKYGNSVEIYEILLTGLSHKNLLFNHLDQLNNLGIKVKIIMRNKMENRLPTPNTRYN